MTDGFSRRHLLRLSGGLVATSALAGCQSQPTGDTTAATTTDPGSRSRTLALIGGPIRTLDPAKAADENSVKVLTQLYEGLLHFPKGNPDPELLLADDVSVSDDGLTYTFSLDPTVEFSTGDGLTAADVAYSFERVAQSTNSSWRSYLLSMLGVVHEMEGDEYVPGSLGVTAVDDSTVAIELQQATHNGLELLAHPAFAVVPEGLVGDIEGYEGSVEYETFATQSSYGTGPFTLESWSQGDHYRVRAREDYHGDGPNIAGIDWAVIESDTAYDYAMGLDADAFWVPDARFDRSLLDVDHVDEQGRLVGTYGPLPENGITANYLGVPLLWMYFIGFNTQSVAKPVRQAVAYAMNQQAHLEQVHKGRGALSAHVTPPPLLFDDREARTEHADSAYPYGLDTSDLEAAREVMEAAGYSESNPADVTFTVYQNSTWRQSAQILQNQLKSVHVNIDIEQAEFGTMYSRGQNGTLEMFSWAWAMDYPAAESFLSILVPGTDNPVFTNWGGTEAAAQASEAWEQITEHSTRSAEDQEIRAAAYRQMEEANWQDVTVLPKYQPLGEGFYYPWLSLPKTGAAGFSKHTYNDVTIGPRDT
ncbi:ABC transporter substrate-binding protein [Haladaptatus sp. GCM10025707]|uniref:ABC transporter substrate-binding protein n=1 Tax=unclassified Haladaptatus TaxID=2622732 RepID=UPI0023E8F20A|nr:MULTISPECIES: ABC transporter substrate-binding protein [unclassified Haladaptatus]